MSPTPLDLLILAVLTMITIFWVRIVMLKWQMRRNRIKLRKAGLYPSGSNASYGMVRCQDGDTVGVQHDARPSRSWYSTLVG